MFGTIHAVLIVSMDNRFGIAVGIEGMAQLLQLFSELKIVVDLAVEDYPRRTFLIVNWLLAALQVDDGQAAHSETNGPINVKAIVVRPAVPDRIAHARQQLFVDRFPVISN
jgi:hypothetical protein